MHSEQDLQRFFESLRMPAEQNGVGTLAEKRLHAALKRYYAPDTSCLEVPIGRYVADVFDGERIVEIQTRQFARLAGKLQFFLERYPTTVVYPMPRTRYLVWTDPETGETKPPRKSPIVGKPLDALHELYHIRNLLGVETLIVELLLFDLDEYRLLDGYGKERKKGSTQVQRIPRSAPELIRLQTPEDYAALLPKDLPECFTASQFAKLAKLKSRQAYSAIHVLEALGIVQEDGTVGKAKGYSLHSKL